MRGGLYVFALDYVLNFIFLALKIEVTTSCFRISRNSDGTISTTLKKTALAGVAIDAPTSSPEDHELYT